MEIENHNSAIFKNSFSNLSWKFNWDNKLNFKEFIFLTIGGFFIRYIFTPFEIPLVLDSLQYFWYGIELDILKEFPSNYDLTNNMWPTFLSPFFSILNSQNYFCLLYTSPSPRDATLSRMPACA